MENKDNVFNEIEAISEAKSTLSRVVEWNKQCDVKLEILIAFVGLVLSSTISMISKLKCDGIIEMLVFVILIICMAISILLFFLALLPEMNIKKYNQKYLNTNSKIYFATISDRVNYEEYRDKFHNMRKQDYLNDLTSQIYINSKIAKRKYSLYNAGLIVSLVGVMLYAFLILLFIVK